MNAPITKAPETRYSLVEDVGGVLSAFHLRTAMFSLGAQTALRDMKELAPLPAHLSNFHVHQKEAADAIAAALMKPSAYDSLARELEQAKAVLERVLPLYQSFVDDSGGCDHSVGICMCEDFAVLSDIRAALKVKPSNEVGT